MAAKKMKYEEKELLQGMRNCHNACGDDFKETVRMVSSSRDREASEVIKTLDRLAKEFGETKEYQKLRAEIPEDFPF